MDYDESVARVRSWSMDNKWIQEAVGKFGLADYGTWLLVDGSWLAAPLPHESVGRNPHEFMLETGSIRWHSTGDCLNIEMMGIPTVDQMRSAAIPMEINVSVIDLTAFRGSFVRQLGTTLLYKPTLVELSKFWRWVEEIFRWQ